MSQYCSPANDREAFCFPRKILIRLAEITDLIDRAKPIRIKPTDKDNAIYTKINSRLKRYCGNGRHWLWCGALERLVTIRGVPNAIRLKNSLRGIEKKNLKPEKPLPWYQKPKTWLSNFDIQNVMQQYSSAKRYRYEFLGVFPIDFTKRSSSGVCMYSKFCTIDIKDYIKRGIKHIGLITNLDRHDEPGSHWTSSFMVIDSNSSSYGAYYYDSAVNTIPADLKDFFDNVQAQCNAIYPKKSFKIDYNKKKHQFKGSECGVFSMIFQVRWINKIALKKNKASFQEITANPFINDEKMLEVRDFFFRPNNRHELRNVAFS